MEQTQTQAPAYAGNLYWKVVDKATGVYEAMDLRILATIPKSTFDLDGSGWLQTRTHQHWYDTDNGKRPFTYECPRGNHSIMHPSCQVPCAHCTADNKHFGAKTEAELSKPTSQRFWVWAIDLKDGNKLKAVDFPFSVYNQIIELVKDPESMTFAEEGKIWNVPLRVERAGVKLNTTYTVKPLRPTAFDLGEALKAQGFDKAPKLMQPYEPRVYPKIVQLDEPQLKDLQEKGLLPWQKEVGPGHEAMSAVKETAPTAPISSSSLEATTYADEPVEAPKAAAPKAPTLDINEEAKDIYEGLEEAPLEVVAHEYF